MAARSLEDPRWTSLCRQACEAGENAHSGLGLTAEVFGTEAAVRIDERLRVAGLEPSLERRARWLEGAAHADLYLAVACGRGAGGAWERLHGSLLSRLVGLARARGADAAEAERLATEVLGDLALPASGADPRPLLSTYAGGGSLFAFLGVLLARRRARRARDPRERGPRSGVETGSEAGRASGLEATSLSPTPEAAAVAADEARCFGQALAQAVQELTSREALVLALKHRDGHSQQKIAALLGVGEPRVSRILASAVERLSGTVTRLCPALDAQSHHGAAALRDVLARHLARLDASLPPPVGSAHAKGPL